MMKEIHLKVKSQNLKESAQDQQKNHESDMFRKTTKFKTKNAKSHELTGLLKNVPM